MRVRFNLGGVDPSAPLSPHYAGGGVLNRLAMIFGNERGAVDTQRKKPSRKARIPIVEFTAAAHEHVESGFDVSLTPTTTAQNSGPHDVPAFGYMRHVLLYVSTSGGDATAGALAADAPWNVFSEVVLEDVNGAAIVQLSGYELFLANLYGGYAFQQDPRLQPDAVTTGVVTYTFALRIPVEIHHNNGLGAIANQNTAAAYKVRFTVNTIANIWSTAPTTTPAVRVRGYLEAWTQPTPQDLAGRPQAVMPPRHGTTQYWSRYTRSGMASGEQSVTLTRVGNLLRTLIFVARATGGGARTTANFPDPVTINWDARQLIREPRYLRRAYMAERYITSSAGHPAGVFVYDFDHDVLGHGGDGTPELWIPTVQSTRLELSGTFAAGDLTVMTNDVAPVEVTQEERYEEFSDTGFNPAPGGAPARV